MSSARSLRTSSATALVLLTCACGPATDDGTGRAAPDGWPSSASEGSYCGSPYSVPEAGFCGCTERCNGDPTSGYICHSFGGTRADGAGCTEGVFTPTPESPGFCTRGRCCDPMVALICDDTRACTLDLCVSGTRDVALCEHVVDCPAAPDECHPGRCDAAWNCEYPYAGDGAACSLGVCSVDSCQAGCWIGGSFRAADSLDPANPCQRCDVATSRTAWTPFDDGTPCGTGQLCVADACRPGCLIDGAWRPVGGAKPGAECWVCDPATPLDWTASFGACGGDGLNCTDDRCGGDGACHHDPIPGCVEPEEASLYGCGSAGASGGLLLAAGALWLLALRRRGHRALAIALLLAALPLEAGAAPARRPGTGAGGAKLAVLTFKAGAGVAPQTAELVTRTLSAAIQARTGFALLTTADLMAVLDFEQQKAALGCTEEDCLAEMGGALGVDWIVTGALGRIGEALAFNAQLVDIRTGVALRRFATTARAGSDEAFLDLVAPAVDALFPDARPPPRFALSVRGEAELRAPLGGAGAILLEARIGAALRAGGGLLATPQHVGALGRVTWLPWRAAAELHPVLSLELTVLGGDGAAFGVGLSPGIEWTPRRELALLLELPLQWFPVAPEHTRAGYALGAASVAWRF